VGGSLLARTWLVVAVLGAAGVICGVLAAHFVTTGADRYMARATLAMVPAPEVPPEDALDYWEVLNRGQATRSAAIALEDSRWLEGVASAAGASAAALSFTAGAIPDTTLITVTMTANSPEAAETSLDTLLTEAIPVAATVSGPFRIEPITEIYGSASSMSPDRLQVVATLGIAGLLIGAGVGLLISRSMQGRSSRRDGEHFDGEGSNFFSAPTERIVATRNGEPPANT
jgi:hypothetical protein